MKFVKSRVEFLSFFENYNYFVEIFFNYDESNSLRCNSTNVMIINSSSIFKYNKNESFLLNNRRRNVKHRKVEINFNRVSI